MGRYAASEAVRHLKPVQTSQETKFADMPRKMYLTKTNGDAARYVTTGSTRRKKHTKVFHMLIRTRGMTHPGQQA